MDITDSGTYLAYFVSSGVFIIFLIIIVNYFAIRNIAKDIRRIHALIRTGISDWKLSEGGKQRSQGREEGLRQGLEIQRFPATLPVPVIVTPSPLSIVIDDPDKTKITGTFTGHIDDVTIERSSNEPE